MSDAIQLATDSELSLIKLRNALNQLTERTEGTSDTSVLLAESMALFKTFFNEISDPEFKPQEMKTGDTPRSDLYNTNLRGIYNDLSRFYRELSNLSNASIKSFNYSQVVITEIKKRAEALSGMVLDLNILNNFTRGDVIVAGDDFINMDKIDSSAALGSSKAELISNGTGLSLARASTNNLTSNPRIKLEVIPISPLSEGTTTTSVNISPTPGNLKRFYEGNYYNFLGLARPEGGQFNIQFIVDPKTVTRVNENKLLPTKSEEDNEEVRGIFLEYGASEEAKAEFRKTMVDNNPDTFWECEYVIKLTNPLIPDVVDSMVITEQTETPSEGELQFSDPEAPTAASIQINVNDLNIRALSQDVVDLVVDIIVTLPEQQNVNFVAINPVVFSKNAFIEVIDLATADEATGQFTTVDGWETIRFPRSITPEANEFLTDSQLAASLSPNRYNYSGQGIYPFPIRIAKKIKLRLSMSQPASQPYEKTYVLLKNNLDVTTTITTVTKKGRLRF